MPKFKVKKAHNGRFGELPVGAIVDTDKLHDGHPHVKAVEALPKQFVRVGGKRAETAASNREVETR